MAPFQDASSAKLLDAIQQLTTQLFPGPVSFAEEFDPAEPTNRYVVFTATANGDWKGVRDRVLEWHNRVRALCPEPVNYFRLDVVTLMLADGSYPDSLSSLQPTA